MFVCLFSELLALWQYLGESRCPPAVIQPLGNASRRQSRDSGVSQMLLNLHHLIALGLRVGYLRSLSFHVLTCKWRPQRSPQRAVWKIYTKNRVSVAFLKHRKRSVLSNLPKQPPVPFAHRLALPARGFSAGPQTSAQILSLFLKMSLLFSQIGHCVGLLPALLVVSPFSQ